MFVLKSASNVQSKCTVIGPDQYNYLKYLVFYGHFCAHGRQNGPEVTSKGNEMKDETPTNLNSGSRCVWLPTVTVRSWNCLDHYVYLNNMVNCGTNI